MPKMKTHSGSKRRFRVTGSGRIKRKKAGMRHIQQKMTTKRKRGLRHQGEVAKVDSPRIMRLLVKA